MLRKTLTSIILLISLSSKAQFGSDGYIINIKPAGNTQLVITLAGNNIELQTNTFSDNQKWRMVSVSQNDNKYYLQSVSQPNKYISIGYNVGGCTPSSQNGAFLTIENFSSSVANRWQFKKAALFWKKIYIKNIFCTGIEYSINVPNGNNSNGQRLSLYNYNNSENQKWKIQIF